MNAELKDHGPRGSKKTPSQDQLCVASCLEKPKQELSLDDPIDSLDIYPQNPAQFPSIQQAAGLNPYKNNPKTLQNAF